MADDQSLGKKNDIPLYYQIQRTLLSKMENGDWPPGMMIPAERELATQFGVSRMTMRNALAVLTRSSHLTREVGRGTFVANRRITQTLNNLTSFSQEMVARGMKPGSELLRLWIEKADPNLAEQLRITTDTPVFHIDRVRLTDNQPIAIEKVALQFRNCIRLLDFDFGGSLYDLLLTKFGIVPHYARQQIQARICTEEESDLLLIPKKSPVLRLTRLTFTKDDMPFEFTESVYRSDKYIFDIRLFYNMP